MVVYVQVDSFGLFRAGEDSLYPFSNGVDFRVDNVGVGADIALSLVDGDEGTVGESGDVPT